MLIAINKDKIVVLDFFILGKFDKKMQLKAKLEICEFSFSFFWKIVVIENAIKDHSIAM